jgi:lipopolysaccharide export system protein LptC
MATADRYSRVVLWLKVALPLAALAILSTLFFVAETLDPEAAIPYADVDVEKILREQGATSPQFGGVTTDGITISLSAASVRPGTDDKNRWTGADLAARLELPDGSTIEIDSPEGIIDATRKEAMLQGGAELKSSTGYHVTTNMIVANIETANVVAEQGIVASGPPGTISAGRMVLKRMDSAPGSYHLVFDKGVRLVHQPGS